MMSGWIIPVEYDANLGQSRRRDEIVDRFRQEDIRRPQQQINGNMDNSLPESNTIVSLFRYVVALANKMICCCVDKKNVWIVECITAPVSMIAWLHFTNQNQAETMIPLSLLLEQWTISNCHCRCISSLLWCCNRSMAKVEKRLSFASTGRQYIFYTASHFVHT